MGYSKEVNKKAAQIILERKNSAERDAEYRRKKIFAEIPEAGLYEKKIASLGIKAGRAVLSGGDVKEELEKMKAESLTLQKEYEALLKSKGYSVSDTEPKYFCEKCGDTGYVELDNRTIMCDCLNQARIEAACEELNRHSHLDLCTFDDFDLDYYGKEIPEGFPRSPYEQMKTTLAFCKAYAESFSLDSENIFMRGKTGLGKTHLSLSIANEVIKKGYGVIYVSAPIIVAQLEKEQFSREKPETSVADVINECDLLIIDDLGTEFANNFSTTAIYNVFNARLGTRKPMIINTNLTLKELEQTYSERFVSRICGEAKRLNFFGKDIRIMKK